MPVMDVDRKYKFMYWVDETQRDFKTIKNYENDFIAVYHDRENPDYHFYKHFKNGKALVNWVSKVNTDNRYGFPIGRIGVHRFYLASATDEQIRERELEYSPDKILVKGNLKKEKSQTISFSGVFPLELYDQMKTLYTLSGEKQNDYFLRLVKQDIEKHKDLLKTLNEFKKELNNE